jgi:hypothetical protein
METLIKKTKSILFQKNGESIMEAVVSMLILSMLLTTIVSIIRFSMVMTGNSISSALHEQEYFNDLVQDNYENSEQVEIIILSVDGELPDGVINAKHDIEFNTSGDIAFFPFNDEDLP